MIGERYAVDRGIPATQRRPSAKTSPGPRPARARQERLSSTLHRSVLVQLLLAMSLVAFAALLYLIQASQASVLEYNIAELQAQQVQLQATNADLQAQVTAFQSPTRIDSLATNQLHMAKPDISTAIWVRPVLPRIVAPRPLNADIADAQRASQPLAWLDHTITFIKMSL